MLFFIRPKLCSISFILSWFYEYSISIISYYSSIFSLICVAIVLFWLFAKRFEVEPF